MNPVTVGLIPARGGSKGIPGKNLKPLAGRPLIAWTIAAAREAMCLARVVVSTDDEAIAEVSRVWGAEVPFRRPASLALDGSGSEGVVMHAIEWLRAHGPVPDAIVLLQPTSPLRTAADITGVCRLATERGAEGVVSVCEVRHHPYYARRLAADGALVPFFDQAGPDGQRLDLLRRQDLPPAYTENGAVFHCRCEAFLRQRTFFFPGVLGYVMPAERSLDIDSPWEFQMADLLMRHAHESARP